MTGNSVEFWTMGAVIRVLMKYALLQLVLAVVEIQCGVASRGIAAVVVTDRQPGTRHVSGRIAPLPDPLGEESHFGTFVGENGKNEAGKTKNVHSDASTESFDEENRNSFSRAMPQNMKSRRADQSSRSSRGNNDVSEDTSEHELSYRPGPKTASVLRYDMSGNLADGSWENVVHENIPVGSSGGCPPRCFCNGTIEGHLTLVNCTELGLETVPSLPATVVTLILRGNLIHNLTNAFVENAPDLNTLDLTNNRIAEINDNPFSSLKNLAYLSVSENYISMLSTSAFHGLIHLVTLDLSLNNLTYLHPRIFYELSNLKILNLHGCSLQKIANDTFMGLKTLHTLDLSSNDLTYTAGTFDVEALRGLEALDTLDIRNNNQLENLQQRVVKSTETGLHDTFAFLSQPLVKGSAWNYSMKGNPSGSTFFSQRLFHVRQPRNNRFLNFSSDHFKNFTTTMPEPSVFDYSSEALSRLRNLRALSLDGVPEAVFGPGFQYLEKLSFLSFSGVCSLGDLKPTLFKYINSSSPLTIGMGGCNVSKIPPQVFSPVPNIVELELTGNTDLMLNGFYNATIGLASSNLTYLNLGDIAPSGGRVFYLSHKLLINLYDTPLKRLILSKNKIYNIDLLFFMCLPPSLEELDLSNNYILSASGLLSIFCMQNLRIFYGNDQIRFHGEDFVGSFFNQTEEPRGGKAFNENADLQWMDDEYTCPDPQFSLVQYSRTNPFTCHCPRQATGLTVRDQPSNRKSRHDSKQVPREIYQTNEPVQSGPSKQTIKGDVKRSFFHPSQQFVNPKSSVRSKRDVQEYQTFQHSSSSEEEDSYKQTFLADELHTALWWLMRQYNQANRRPLKNDKKNVDIAPTSYMVKPPDSKHKLKTPKPPVKFVKEFHAYVARQRYKREGMDLSNSNDITVPFPPKLEILKLNRANLPYGIPKIEISNPNALKHLEYSGNRAFCWGGPLVNTDLLEYLDLSGNDCRLINLDFFSGSRNVKTFLMNQNSLGHPLGLDSSGKFFSYLTRLEHLEMRSSLINYLPPAILQHNTNLRHLDLSKNFMQTFDVRLSNAPRMLLLNLSQNLLKGLAEFSVREIRHTRLNQNSSARLLVDLRGQVLDCSCEYLEFMHFLCSDPEAFVSPEELKCSMPKAWTQHRYKEFPRFCSDLRLIQQGCFSQDWFMAMVILSALLICAILLAAGVHRYRWRLQYLYYIGQPLARQPNVDIFLTFDREDQRIRTVADRLILPRLERERLTVTVGERDFQGGDELKQITAAIVDCKKVMILLSDDIFADSLREFELNMAVIHEMKSRRRLVLPVFLEDADEIIHGSPPEIQSFLDSQHERCLYYSNTEAFWDRVMREMRAWQDLN